MIGIFILSLLVGFSGAIVPGPLFALTLKQALYVGWSAGLWLSIGHMIAELALVIGLKAGLGRILQRPLVTRIIGFVGGIVLLYFAWGMIAVLFTTQSLHATASGHTAPLTITSLTIQGIVLTVVNPYWYIWWATVGVGLIGAQVKSHGERAWPAFFIGHSMADYVWYIAVSMILAFSGSFLSPAVHRGLIAICGVGVAVLGIMFIFRQVSSWRQERNFLPAGD
ncbi:MAG TPA: LysE family transporter [Armatimonadota bacterium]|nr:LysE family transporter [Armatimonadota bacterium]